MKVTKKSSFYQFTNANFSEKKIKIELKEIPWDPIKRLENPNDSRKNLLEGLDPFFMVVFL